LEGCCGEPEELGRLGCAALVAAAIAFPTGVMVGSRGTIRQKDGPDGSEAHKPRAPAEANYRNVFSPDIRHDPYVQDQQRKIVEALQAQCRQTGEHCDLADAGRQWLSKQR
jgi:hypothetical protein